MSENYRGSITLTSISEGRGYSIETNHEKVNKFYDGNKIGYSSDDVMISAYLTQDNTRSILNPSSEYNLEIWIVGMSDYGDIAVFDSLSYLTGRKIGTSDTPQPLLSVAKVINPEQPNSIHFNFAALCEYEVTGDTSAGGAKTKDFDFLVNLIKNENFYFLIKLYPYNSIISDTNVLATKPLVIEFGTSEDMAKFALTATNIQAAIANTGMRFDSNGLTIINGGFSIQTQESGQDPVTVFGFDDDNGLYIEGNGSFSGEIHASTGDFTGTVSATTLTANAGNIGGFIITNDGLFSTAGYSSDTSVPQKANLQLYGGDGTVVANTITLGTGATIEDYIQLGQDGKAFLYNPDKHSGIIVKTENATLTEDGVFTIGEITLDGPNSVIYGTNFNITPNLSTFNNVNVTGKITTAVFETGKVQAAGGAMFFKQSYKVEKQEGSVLTLDQDFSTESGHYVYLIKKDGTFLSDRIQVTSVKDTDHKEITLSSIPAAEVFSIVDVGKVGDTIIGVNSGNASIQGVLYPRGFTISEIDSSSNVSIKAFLGDLGGLGKVGLSGNGLYGENVFLTGSLTTKTISEEGTSYAGVNTLSGATATIFDNSGITEDNSEIIFWAGSQGIDASSIQASPFQVTRDGSLYSSQGLFEGAIISRSEIRGVDIFAARIHGTGEVDDGEPGLSFYNIANGIAFFKGDYGASPVQTFHIGSNGFAYGVDENYFITINGNIVNANLNEASIGKLKITDKRIYNIENSSTIELDTGVNISDGNNNYISITNSSLELNHKETLISDVLTLGSKLQYKKAIVNDSMVGYNLYVI